MLNIQVAQLLVEKLMECTDYNINIMDQSGIIIASRDASRVNQFHEGAYQMVRNGDDILEISNENSLLGSREGTNMALRENGKIIGVVGITGKLEEVRPIALILKMTVETILELEERKQKAMRHSNLKQFFINSLIYGNVQKTELISLAKQLSYPTDLIRVPILIQQTCYNSSELLEQIKKDPHHTGADISAVIWNDLILVFKHVPQNRHVPETYRSSIEEYLDVWRKACNDHITFFIGTLQRNISLYHASFLHASFLHNNIRPSPDENAVYFYDHVAEFFQESLPWPELETIFSVYCEGLDQNFANEFVPFYRVLHQENFNLVSASKRLFIHKNTLFNRLERYKHMLDINPIRSGPDRSFFEALGLYLQKKYQIPL